MCLFQSGHDIPPLVRLSLRTLQYLVIPLLSIALLCVGALHLGVCPAQPLLPVWHIVAGSSGLVIPVLYLLFDEVNPGLSRRCPAFSEVLDNLVVFLLPVYVLFEVAWLVTGSVWIFGTEDVTDPDQCDHTIYIFTVVVIVNFWIHLLTPLIFMLGLCCTRLFPYCAYCGYWNILKTAMDNWTRKTRMSICMGIALPLGVSMVICGGISSQTCGVGVVSVGGDGNVTISDAASHQSEVSAPNEQQLETKLPKDSLIPLWLFVAGCAVIVAPVMYLIYDKYCKSVDGGPLIKQISTCLVIFYLLCSLIWSVVGFLWVFGAHQDETCGADSFTYQFAFSTLIIMNIVMDFWICFKICVVLYWAFLSDD